MIVKHSKVKYEYQPNSYESYRHYVECECGFQARVGTEEAAKSQLDSHLVSNGLKPHFKESVDKKEVKKEETGWKPFQ